MLDWRLCDLAGNTLAYLDDRLPGAQVKPSLNAGRTAQVTLSLDDAATALVYPLNTVLRCSMDGVPLFAGVVLKPRFSGSAGTVTIPAVDPSIRLRNFHLGQRSDGFGLQGGYVGGNPWRWQGVDQAFAVAALVDHAKPTSTELAAGIPDHGIVNNGPRQSGGILRDRELAPGTEVWAAIIEMTGLSGGVDIELAPIEDPAYPAVLCRFGVYHPWLGADRTASVRFEYQWGAENCSDFAWEPAGDLVLNRSTWVGQSVEGLPQQAATADQPEAEQAFGIYGDWQSRPDIIDSETLAEYAQGVVSAQSFPIDTFEVIPALDDGSGYTRNTAGVLVKSGQTFGVPPRFGPPGAGDYWIGDLITAAANLGAVQADLQGRVVDATMTEDDAGSIVTTITCVPTVDSSGVTSTQGLLG